MKVYKYRGGSFDRDLESVSENYFWAPTRHNLNDPCEGIFDDSVLRKQVNLFYKISRIIKAKVQTDKNLNESFDEFQDHVDNCGIYSLSKTPLEDLLWAHYADSHKGFCLEYDLDKLSEFGREDFNYIDIKYSNRPLSLRISWIIKGDLNKFIGVMIGVKSKHWAYERESRIITSRPGRQDYDYRALKSVYFGMRMPEFEKRRFMEELKGRGVSYFNIVHERKDYKLQYEHMTDVFLNAEKYLDNLAEIPNPNICILPVGDKYKAYESYLKKAVEITRREPYCDKIEYVGFSPTKGSLENPIVFVQYKINQKYVNFYLSLKDIDNQYPKLNPK